MTEYKWRAWDRNGQGYEYSERPIEYLFHYEWIPSNGKTLCREINDPMSDDVSWDKSLQVLNEINGEWVSIIKQEEE